ncbi:pre-toxin TG domain-containing protein [Enterococcus sp. BWT-B8]|uniref:pre-toxin TG domain-containing protein n=1 Tax=Enterococcus sp. BWT-B8 TaxID=2885157 RepID=UPI001E544169|nr:pre-toxin TG domain-containing protein [Enterococcus sp. BWT-B8]MCB5953275.1 pre-toxin TG domain-containing protein [Enterococcus sp. BWT-B8]
MCVFSRDFKVEKVGEKGSVIIETNGQGSSADIMLQTMDLMTELFLSDVYQFFTGRNFNTYGKLTIGERAFSGFMMALDFVPFGKVVDVLKLGKYTDEAMDLMRKYGDEFSEMLGKYSEEMLELTGNIVNLRKRKHVVSVSIH